VFACRGFNGTIPDLIPIGEYEIIIPKEELKQELYSMDNEVECNNCGNIMSLTGYKSGGREKKISDEEPKQETLEEREPYWDLVDKKAEQNNSIDLDAYAKGVQDGVKWQQERMYSEEDLRKAFNDGKENVGYDEEIFYSILTEQEWFEQFKKKL
jgi:hypothetical protein